jgi:hypothetical protein
VIEIPTIFCSKCAEYGLVPASCWGVMGEEKIRLAILLQQSDYRENGGYLPALLKSKTGGLIFKVCNQQLEDIAILNSVKCIHSIDRKKTPSEQIINNCRENTIRQILTISPEGIIISGSVALRSLLGKTDTNTSRGQRLDWNGFPTLHIGHFGRAATRNEIDHASTFIRRLREN